MAPVVRVRFNNLAGKLGGSLTATSTTITFAGPLTYDGAIAVPTIAAPDYIPLTLEPGSGNFEVVWLTAYTQAATTGTILRGVEGAPVGHANGVSFAHAQTVMDFAVNQPGIYMPPGWNQNWAAKLQGAPASKPVVACVGTSIINGSWASSLYSKGWSGLLRASLQAQYGYGGDGFIGEGQCVIDEPTYTGVDVINKVPFSGGGITKYVGATQYEGPGASVLVSTASYGSTQTLTVIRSGDKITPYVQMGSGHGAFTYTVDGVTAPGGPFSTNNASGAVQALGATSGWGTGQHTVVLSIDGSQPTITILGFGFENTSGVVMNVHAHGGHQSAYFVDQNPPAANQPMNWCGGQYYPCDLLICDLGVNDAFFSVTAAVFIQNIRTFLEAIRDTTTSTKKANTDLLFIMNHVGEYDTINQYHLYAAGIKSLCETYGAGMIDFWTLGRNSWQNWKDLSYWGNDSSNGNPGSSTVHPGDIGHAYMASVITPYVMANAVF